MKKKNQSPIVTEAVLQIPNNNVNQISDTSPIIPQRSKLKSYLKISQQQILTEKQKEFLALSKDKDVKLIFVSGPAGTSKTYLSILTAIEMINEKRVSDLIYIRSAVESADAKLGFLPGEINDKMSPYIKPLMDKLYEFMSKGDINVLMKEERIRSIPVGFLRGLNWNAMVVVADEAQNLTFKELFTLITRIGRFTKVFILGDSDQSDINGKSGFIKMISTFDDEESRQNGIHVFRFTEDDIVRSGLVQFIVRKVKKCL